MKIIIGIAGEGYGHATRSKSVIEHLKNHKLEILTGGKTYAYLSNYYNLRKITSQRLVYVNNEVSTVLSAVNNSIKLPFDVYSLLKTFFVFLVFKPEIIINDFEIFTNWIGFVLRIPIIHIDNGRIVLEGDIETPKKPYLSYLKVLFWGKIINPSKHFGLIPSFFKLKCKKNNRIVFPPLRKEITKLKTKDSGFALVYQTSSSYTKLIKELKKINMQFIIYGFNKEAREENLVFRKFNEDSFFQDLANCSFVITNGGFSLISESIYLKKPVLSCPVRKQFEQEVNAFYLDKLCYGKSVKSLTAEDITEFIKNKKTYKKQLYKLKWKNNFFIELNKVLKKFTS